MVTAAGGEILVGAEEAKLTVVAVATMPGREIRNGRLPAASTTLAGAGKSADSSRRLLVSLSATVMVTLCEKPPGPATLTVAVCGPSTLLSLTTVHGTSTELAPREIVAEAGTEI